MIGKGVDDLHELAKQANEEVRLQSKMLDVLEAKIDDVHDHVTNVNVKLKTTLEEARKSDKICMVRSTPELILSLLICSFATSHRNISSYQDIVCLLILVGMVVVVYKTSMDKQ